MAQTEHPAARLVDVGGLVRAQEAKEVNLLLDVRSPEEFAEGHVANSLNMPLGDLERRVSELARWQNAEIWVICRSGRRSAAAASILSSRGFRVADVGGGVEGWRAAGLSLKSGVSP